MFEDSGYVPSIQATNAARRFIKQEITEKLKSQGLKGKQLDTEIRLQTQAEMDKLAGGKGQFANVSTGFESFSKIREGILVEKQQIPKPIKEYLGEITDPTEKLLISMKKIAQFVEDSNFIIKLTEMVKIFIFILMIIYPDLLNKYQNMLM